MEFDESNKAIMETLTREEALVYIKFLLSEEKRHWDDIRDIQNLIEEVKRRFEL